jgi:large subunit ribosomal protein L5
MTPDKKVNPHALARIEKVLVGVGVGKNRDNVKYGEAVKKDLAAITGQAPARRLAKKSVAGFNVRQGNVVGFHVTLRGKRANDFVTRLIHVTLPRVRDFRGISKKGFDRHGNLTIGLKEQLAFPEIHPDQTDVVFGVRVTIVTTATTDADGEALLRGLGFPLT